MPEALAVPALEVAAARAADVCAAIVTYADRFTLLAPSLHVLLAQGVGAVVVVDNGCAAQSRAALEAAAARDTRLRVLALAQNGGSAEGFAAALRGALASGLKFVWLLDDDNRPERGALQALLDAWRAHDGANRAAQLALASLRIDRPSFVAAIVRGRGECVLPPRDAFAGFHIGRLAALLRERIGAAQAPADLAGAAATTPLPASAWGGLFAHRALFDALPPPSAGHVLYMDDFEYTCMIPARGGEILLVRDSVVHDAEASSHLPRRKGLLHHSVFEARSDAAAYYALRNGVHFARRHLTDRPWLYRLNAVAFVVLVGTIGALRGRWRRLAVAATALRDGVAGRLGRHPVYRL